MKNILIAGLAIALFCAMVEPKKQTLAVQVVSTTDATEAINKYCSQGWTYGYMEKPEFDDAETVSRKQAILIFEK